MSVMLSAKEICERALRKIGAFPINDTAADGEELAEALSWLDLTVAEQAGSTRCFWLVPATLSVSLTADTAEYDLITVLASSAPDDGLQFPVSATVKDDNGNETPLKLVTRTEYEEITDKTVSGTPELIWIDRLENPTMKTYPVLGTGLTGWSIELVVQTFAPDFHKTTGSKSTGLRAAWQKWAVYELSAVLGDGTIRRLPDREITMFEKRAKEGKDALEAYENRQHANTTQRVAYRDF